MDLVPPTSSSVITVALPRERTNAKKSAMLRPKCHKIKAEFPLMQRCASYMHKKRKGHSFCQRASSGPRRLGLAGPTQTSLQSSKHVLWPNNLLRSKECLLKNLFNIFKIRNRKPESNTDLGDTQAKKRKNKWRAKFVSMTFHLNHHRVFCMEQIISSTQVWHNISLVMTTSWPWISPKQRFLPDNFLPDSLCPLLL